MTICGMNVRIVRWQSRYFVFVSPDKKRAKKREVNGKEEKTGTEGRQKGEEEEPTLGSLIGILSCM